MHPSFLSIQKRRLIAVSIHGGCKKITMTPDFRMTSLLLVFFSTPNHWLEIKRNWETETSSPSENRALGMSSPGPRSKSEWISFDLADYADNFAEHALVYCAGWARVVGCKGLVIIHFEVVISNNIKQGDDTWRWRQRSPHFACSLADLVHYGDSLHYHRSFGVWGQ